MTNRRYLSSILLIAAGAAMMFLFDPQGGGRRRAQLRDRSRRFLRDAADGTIGVTRDLGNRAYGVSARLRRVADRSPVDDSTLEARVRAALGRATSHPGAIHVTSVNGVVTMMGPVLAREHADVCRAVSNVPGVLETVDELTQHEHAGSVPALQGDPSIAF